MRIIKYINKKLFNSHILCRIRKRHKTLHSGDNNTSKLNIMIFANMINNLHWFILPGSLSFNMTLLIMTCVKS